MRNPLLALAGLVAVLVVVASTAQSYFRQPPPPPASPYYVDGQPMMSNPNPPDRNPEEKAARAAHHAAVNGVYAAFDHPWPAMCTPERHTAFVKALNAYYGERTRFARVGGWLRPDESKDTAFDWQTLDD